MQLELNKCLDDPVSWIGRLNIVNVLVLLILIYRFNEIQIKITSSYFVDIDKVIINFMWGKISRMANTILKRKKVERWMMSKFKNFYKAAEIMAGSLVSD